MLRKIVICMVAALFIGGISSQADKDHKAKIRLMRTPNNGIQQQAVIDDLGTLHLVYFTGEPSGGDIYYVFRKKDSQEFSNPIKVNSQPGSAVATGTVRGPHLAIGKNRRVHVSWNGSNKAEPRGPHNSSPMLYSRMSDNGSAFEPQRNLMQVSHELDGGGSIAADNAGDVYVAWHGDIGQLIGEEHRRIWVARSTDDGITFSSEITSREETGACGCCGIRASVDSQGTLYLLYRTATHMTERGMFLLVSDDKGRTFRGRRVDEWTLSSCPLSTASISGGDRKLAAWENNKQVYFASLDAKLKQKILPVAAPGETGKRKHPSIATDASGNSLLVWVESEGWKKGGSLGWQLFDRNGKPLVEKGAADGVPAYGLATALASPDGQFIIIY